MKYLVLFMESGRALPVDMLDRRLCSRDAVDDSTIAGLLSRVELGGGIELADIDGYTTLDVDGYDQAMEITGNWRWTGGVKVLPMKAAEAVQ